nr:TetR/AcrR family transcriptional regulator [uncultured Flavobacterium sp.]
MKEAILNKSLRMFVNHGFKSITMDDIAKEMGISKKTIYQHFESKNKLVAETVDYVFDSATKRIKEISKTSITPIHEHFDMKNCVGDLFGHNIQPSSIYQFNKYFPDLAKKVEKRRRLNFESTIIKNLKDGVEQGYYRSDIDIEFIGRVFFLSSSSFLKEDIFEELLKTKTIDELNVNFLEYHLRGIVTPKGLTVLEEILKNLN